MHCEIWLMEVSTASSCVRPAVLVSRADLISSLSP